ncbi:MAG: LysR family transcriptional regulator [Actinomycetota bacterium]|nr:LysR family transcriptional regulator [Actinomycetota bacterium]
MDVRRLELLRELSDRGSVTAVAEALHLTPSAVSQQLKTLEREAGVPLTERAGRGLVLTTAGHALAETAKDVAVALEKAEAAWSEFVEQPRGEVSVTFFPTGGEMLLPGFLTRVADVPGLKVVCTDQDPLLPDFADLAFDHDIVVADAPGVLPSWRERHLVAVELMREPLDIVLPDGHPLAAKLELTPADVAGENWIGNPDGFPFDRILQRVEAITGQEAHRVQRFIDNSIVEVLVASGHGIAILPRFTTRDRENGLVTRPLVGVRSERVIWAIMRPDRAVRPSVRLVVEALRAEARQFFDAHAG